MRVFVVPQIEYSVTRAGLNVYTRCLRAHLLCLKPELFILSNLPVTFVRWRLLPSSWREQARYPWKTRCGRCRCCTAAFLPLAQCKVVKKCAKNSVFFMYPGTAVYFWFMATRLLNHDNMTLYSTVRSVLDCTYSIFFVAGYGCCVVVHCTV